MKKLIVCIGLVCVWGGGLFASGLFSGPTGQKLANRADQCLTELRGLTFSQGEEIEAVVKALQSKQAYKSLQELSEKMQEKMDKITPEKRNDTWYWALSQEQFVIKALHDDTYNAFCALQDASGRTEKGPRGCTQFYGSVCTVYKALQKRLKAQEQQADQAALTKKELQLDENEEQALAERTLLERAMYAESSYKRKWTWGSLTKDAVYYTAVITLFVLICDWASHTDNALIPRGWRALKKEVAKLFSKNNREEDVRISSEEIDALLELIEKSVKEKEKTS